MRKTNTRSAAPKIAESAAQWIESVYPNLNAGLTWLADTAQIHYNAALDEIKGVFSTDELSTILDALSDSHGMVYGPTAMSGQLLDMTIGSDSPIRGSLAMLTRHQKATLETWCMTYHLKNTEDRAAYISCLA